MILFVDVGGRLYHFSPVENAESEILWTITLIKDKMGSKNDRAEWIKTIGTCVTLMMKKIFKKYGLDKDQLLPNITHFSLTNAIELRFRTLSSPSALQFIDKPLQRQGIRIISRGGSPSPYNFALQSPHPHALSKSRHPMASKIHDARQPRLAQKRLPRHQRFWSFKFWSTGFTSHPWPATRD